MRFDPLPSTLAIDKPRGQEAYKPSVLDELERHGALIGTRKADGHQLRAEVCEDRRVRLYTRRMHQVDGRLDYIREEIADAKLPERTLLLGELVFRNTQGHDDEAAVGSLMSSGKERANELLSHGPLPTYIPFNVLHPTGATLEGVPYWRALADLDGMFPKPSYVSPIVPLGGDLRSMEGDMFRGDWEGLVVYDRQYTPGFRLKGEPATPHGCYKFKPHASDDFIVFARHRKFEGGALKDVELLQWDPRAHKLFSCGRLGAFNAATRAKLSSGGWDVLVMEVRFVRRWPKKGTLREPAFVRLRDPKDKDADSCIAPRSYPGAEYLK